MAANSKREQILGAVKTTLEAIDSIEHVERKPLKSMSELEEYPQTQLPLAVVLGSLPNPVEKVSDRDIILDRVRSVVTATIFVYAIENDNPDTKISTLADDIWAAIYNDMTLGLDWVIGLRIVPDIETAFWYPYIAFNMQVEVTYLHGKGGI